MVVGDEVTAIDVGEGRPLVEEAQGLVRLLQQAVTETDGLLVSEESTGSVS